MDRLTFYLVRTPEINVYYGFLLSLDVTFALCGIAFQVNLCKHKLKVLKSLVDLQGAD